MPLRSVGPLTPLSDATARVRIGRDVYGPMFFGRLDLEQAGEQQESALA